MIDYPLNIGGRPLHSAGRRSSCRTFETTILFAALTAVLGMLALNGLPMPYHPVFNVPRFARGLERRVLPLRSRRPIRSSTRTARASSSTGCIPWEVSDIAP